MNDGIVLYLCILISHVDFLNFFARSIHQQESVNQQKNLTHPTLVPNVMGHRTPRGSGQADHLAKWSDPMVLSLRKPAPG